MHRLILMTFSIFCALLMLVCSPFPGHSKQATPSTPTKRAAPAKAPPTPQEVLHEKDERVFGDYTLRIAHTLDDSGSHGTFIALQNGKKVYELKGSRFFFGHVYGDDPSLDNEVIAVGKDITGNGVPNLVVSEWSGGAHCCFVFHIYELGPTFREVATIDAGHGDLSHFADLDGDGIPEFVTSDWTFAYWRAGFAQSPAPEVILRFQDSGYRLAINLMRKPKPTPETLQAEARNVRNDPGWTQKDQPPALWDTMLRLVYEGNGDLVREFLDMAWPLSIPGKEPFYRDFRDTLAKSPYRQDLLELNGGNLP